MYGNEAIRFQHGEELVAIVVDEEWILRLDKRRNQFGANLGFPTV
jgi:hypothetical protein